MTSHYDLLSVLPISIYLITLARITTASFATDSPNSLDVPTNVTPPTFSSLPTLQTIPSLLPTPVPQTTPPAITVDYSYLKSLPIEVIPDPKMFQMVNYTGFELQDLGEIIQRPIMPPKTVKITRTVAVKVPSPYPVPVHKTIPFPVPIHKPYPVTITKVVYVPQLLPSLTKSEANLQVQESQHHTENTEVTLEPPLMDILAKFMRPEKDGYISSPALQSTWPTGWDGNFGKYTSNGFGPQDQEALLKQLARYRGFSSSGNANNNNNSNRLYPSLINIDDSKTRNNDNNGRNLKSHERNKPYQDSLAQNSDQIFYDIFQRLRNNSGRYARGSKRFTTG